MIMHLRLLSSILFVAFFAFSAQAAKVEKYLPEHSFQSNLTKPEQVLGFGLGERHIRHDQLVRYMEVIAEQSSKVKLTEIGYTTEMRRQILVTISSEKNIARLPELLKKETHGRNDNEPLVVWLGYSVHGDEISGSNASLAIAYYLAASQDPQVQQMLADTIIVLEPSINPDGMDRFTTWVNTHRGATANPDPNHIEHHQDWRTGRTNHYGFDMNRDWLLLSQKETQNRMAYFHQYQPHVLGDFHEMGANSTYFFQPGIPSRTHPFTPKKNTELTQLLATFHGAALDKEDRLYYSQENFDDFYYGKGSTYPDINGGVGVLFEQASSRGYQQDSINGLLTFEYGIKNHVLTSISSIEGAWKNQQQFKQYRQSFYQDALKAAEKEKFAGYLLTDSGDSQRMDDFLTKLSQHKINVYPLTESYKLNDKKHAASTSYYVPLAQKQYRVIKALFSQGTNFKDNTFYDVSGWTMPLAMDINFHQVKRERGLSLAKNIWQPAQKALPEFDAQAYAYIFQWHEFLAPRLLNQLQQHGINAKVATKTFSSIVNGEQKEFSTGSIVLPAAIQTVENWRELVQQFSQENEIAVFGISTGLTPTGVDIGSRSIAIIDPVKVLLIGGKGSSQYEAAEVLYYLDKMLSIPVTVVEQPRLSRIDFNAYSHIIMVDGSYKALGKSTTAKFKAWLKQGGTVIAQKRAAQWLSKNEMLHADFVSKETINELFDTDNLTYKDKESLSGRKRIAGAIFEADLDLSHPLTFGFTDQQLPLFKNSTLIMKPSDAPFSTVATFTPEPLMSGYTDRNLVNKIAHSPAVIAHNVGKGKVIATTNVLAFRGYWLGSAKLLSNSLFFSNAFSASGK